MNQLKSDEENILKILIRIENKVNIMYTKIKKVEEDIKKIENKTEKIENISKAVEEVHHFVPFVQYLENVSTKLVSLSYIPGLSYFQGNKIKDNEKKE
jgi:predicted  nucleic acid-binding Zn-ribbon protein